MSFFIETERLILRAILPTDLDGMFDLDSDPAVHQYLDSKPIVNKEQSAEMISFIRQQYSSNGIGRWAVIDKKTQEFMGWSGLKLITEETNGHVNYYDLGYRLLRGFWGFGFATESAVASLYYAFNTLQAAEVYAIAHCGNDGSNNVLRKIGMNFVETFYHKGLPCNWYKIDKRSF